MDHWKPFSFFCSILLALSNSNHGLGDDFLTCGGFVKSKVPIDFSKVEIKLLTAEGIQKYQTECAPNNGYYMVPFVDKGDFILTVQPPEGWTFEPMSVKLRVDGETDPCSLGRDINFNFLGFSISGQIFSIGSSKNGPDGVRLELWNDGSTGSIDETTSTDGGKFLFSSIYPGSYKIVASHESYTFENNAVSVSVAQSNVQCPSTIIVSGYNVQGKVSAAQLPVKDVHILLFGSKSVITKVKGCSLTPPAGSAELVKSNTDTFICSVASNDQGSFSFPSLPPSDYTLVPFHKAEHIEFDVEPQVMTFTVASGAVTLPKEFAVTGFSVTGLVLDAPMGNPVSGAEVFVNGKKQAVTNDQGSYRLQHMNSGMFKITLKKEDIFFPESSVRVGSDTPRLPDIVANKFSLCGSLAISKKPVTPFTVDQLSVIVSNANAEVAKKLLKRVSGDGSFCLALSPGSYIVSPAIPPQLVEAGIKLSPSMLEVTMTNTPVKNIVFEQVLVDVIAHVKCIDSCHEVTVEMNREGGKRKTKLKSEKSTKEKSVELSFNEILPGSYHFVVIQDKWCWQENEKTVEVTDSGQVYEVEFQQSGYKLMCSLSHDIDLVVRHNKELVDTFSLKKGRNKLCLEKAGKYSLVPKSCHKFEESEYTYYTSLPEPLALQAVSHQMSLKIESTHPDKSLSVVIKTKSKETNVKLSDISEKDSEVHTYRAYHFAKEGETLQIIPKSDILLFDPPSLTATVRADDCAKDVGSFSAFKGLFIQGAIVPKLGDVDITITRTEDEKIIEKLKTDKNGKYKVGPLNPKFSYAISAAKDGYVLVQDEAVQGKFAARKLSKIFFTVTLDDTNEPLPGVLVSVSGGSFRSNSLTDEGGNLVLEKLEPGQYYFKAIMKEYEFQPSSQVTEVNEGDELKIGIKGKRVAFSCYGFVTSLNGLPESNVTVQAFSVGQGLRHAEEAVTNEHGIFRIKGFIPNTEYQVEVKKSSLFDRVSPSETTVVANNADVQDLRFISFRSLSQFELTGNVVTDNPFLKSLKVILHKASDPNTPVHTASLTHSPFFHFPPLPRDNQEYHVRLESTLDKSKYVFTEPAAGFFASGVYKHLTFQFQPQIKTIEHDMPQASYLTLPLTILVIFLIYNHTKVMNWAMQLVERSNLINGGGKKDAQEQSQMTRIPPRKARREK